MGSYKFENRKGVLGDILMDAYSELQSLRDEMREGYDNMESGNLGQVQKCQTYGETADALDNFVDDEPDVPAAVSDLQVGYGVSVKKGKRGGPSRAVRRDNATSVMSAAREALEAWIEGMADEDGQSDEGDKDAVQELIDKLDNDTGEAEGVEFPGMFG